MSDIEWREENNQDARRLIALGPGGYRARIEVKRDEEVTARLGRPEEDHDSFDVAVHPPHDQVNATVERLKVEIEERFEALESGHS